MSFFRKLSYLLTNSQRRKLIVLLMMIVISMMLEMLGIGLIIPVMTLVTQPNLLVKYPFLNPWFAKLGYPSQEYLIVLSMLTLTLVYLIKTGFLACLAWMQAKFAAGVQTSVSSRFFYAYLRQPYVFHLQRNSAQLIQMVTGESNYLMLAITAAMTLLTDLLLFTGVIASLLYVEPVGAIFVALTFGVTGTIFHIVTKSRVLRWGKARQQHDRFRLQHLQQGLGGVKDVKLLGREQEFLSQYNVHNVGYSQIVSRLNVIQALPRLWLELLTVLSLVVLVLTMLAQGRPAISFIPALGLFSAAAFRLMPGMNRMLTSMQNLRYALPAINTVYAEMRELNQLQRISTQQFPWSFACQLELCAVGFCYPNAATSAIVNANLVVNKGTSVGIIGESGAGKSTLIDLILGLLTPTHGLIKVDGVDIQSNLRSWQDQIGYVPQSIFLSDDTIRRNIAFGLASEDIDEEAVKIAIKAAQLEELISTLPKGLDTIVGERGVRLSGGQRQRIGIARALYHNPAVLVLDEATSSLDTPTEQSVMEAVYALKGARTLIIIAHRLSTVQHCDRLIRVDRGRLIEEKMSAELEAPLKQSHPIKEQPRQVENA